MKEIQMSYFDLSAGLKNPYFQSCHSVLVSALNASFDPESSLFKKMGDFNLDFFVTTKLGTEELRVTGPRKSKKYQVVEYSIFLPDKIEGMKSYIELVIQGIERSISRYDDFSDQTNQVLQHCMQTLKLE